MVKSVTMVMINKILSRRNSLLKTSGTNYSLEPNCRSKSNSTCGFAKFVKFLKGVGRF